MTRVRLASRGLRGRCRTGARAATAPRARSGRAVAAAIPRFLLLAASALGSALLATSPTSAELASVSTPSSPPTETEAAPAVLLREGAAGRQIEARTNERLLGVCAAATAENAGDTGGRRRLLLLTAPPGDPAGPRTLFELDLAGEPVLRPLATDLSGAAEAITALDLDGDGTQEILVAGRGRIDVLHLPAAPSRATPRLLLAEPRFDPRSPDARRLRVPAASEHWLLSAEPGHLVAFRADGTGGLVAVAELPLPLAAEREARGLQLRSPALTVFGEDEQGALRFATAPLAAGPLRLRSVLFQLSSDGNRRQLEAWFRLPAPETPSAAWWLEIEDEKPLLAVTTQSAGELNLFENKQLRLFAPAEDRTRRGRQPLLAVESAGSRWQHAQAVTADVDADGRRDLVLVQPAGLRGQELLVEAFRGLGAAHLASQPWTSRLEAEAEAWLYGEDFDRDGEPDLALVTESELLLYRGRQPHRRGFLQPAPALRFELATGAEPARTSLTVGTGGVVAERGPAERELVASDLDGDGRPEILALELERSGAGTLRVFFLTPAGPWNCRCRTDE